MNTKMALCAFVITLTTTFTLGACDEQVVLDRNGNEILVDADGKQMSIESEVEELSDTGGENVSEGLAFDGVAPDLTGVGGFQGEVLGFTDEVAMAHAGSAAAGMGLMSPTQPVGRCTIDITDTKDKGDEIEHTVWLCCDKNPHLISCTIFTCNVDKKTGFGGCTTDDDGHTHD